MVHSRRPPSARSVAGHYDALDRYYREIWGEHVHHGLWRKGTETSQQATEALIELVAARAKLAPGASVCDIGCGYGGTARLLAARHGAKVTGVTLSSAQHAHAVGGADVGVGPAPQFLLGNWLDTGLPSASFDAAIAIESLSHMPDLPEAFDRAAGILRPGGRLVVVDWLTADRPGPIGRRVLLEPICGEGRLPQMASALEYAQLMTSAGLRVEFFTDLTDQARRTWTVCLTRLARLLARDRGARRFLLGAGNPDRRFGLSMLRIPVAYRTGAMRLGLLSAVRD